MKTALFAAALLMSTAAIAQKTDTTTPADAATAPMSIPDNSAPRPDNNGTPVISAPAIAPPGFNQAPGMNGVGGPYVDPSQPPAPQPAIGDYPPCSRTVTDHCIQNYERGVRRTRRHK